MVLASRTLLAGQKRRFCALAEAFYGQAAVFAGFDLEIGDGANKVGKPGEAVIADREARYGLGALPEFRERGITLVIALRRLVGSAEHVEQVIVDGIVAGVVVRI